MNTSVMKRKMHDNDEDSSPPKIVPISNDIKPTVYVLAGCIGPKRLEIMRKSVEKMGYTLSPRMAY
jgi:hypothetical protein